MRTLPTLFLLFTLMYQNINAADTDPANDTCAGADVITQMNFITTNNVHEEGPSSFLKGTDRDDYYTFQINATGTLTFYMTSDNTSDVYIGTNGCGSEALVINNAVSGDSTQVNITSGNTVVIYVYGSNATYDYGFDLVFKVAAAPIANDDNAATLQDTPVDIDVTANDTDDASIDKTTVEITTPALNGSTSVDPVTGIVTYTPNKGFSGVDYFDYEVKDNLGNVSETANVTILVKIVSNTTPCTTGTVNGYEDFCLRKQIMLPGNIHTIGNTVLVAPNSDDSDDANPSADCSTYTNGLYIDDATKTNDQYNLCKYHIDGGVTPATLAVVTFPDSNNSEIEWAGLYWQALVDNTVDLTAQQIKIKNGDSGYVTIGYDKLNYEASGFTGTNSYAAFKDVTSVLIDNDWKDGNYTVANIPVKEGKYGTLGTFGAWSLVIIYRNTNETIRSFSVFDGYQKVDNEDDKDTTDIIENDIPIAISGFYTPKSGDIHASVSIFTGEGDNKWLGDTLTAFSNATTTLLPAGSNNSFNSTVDPAMERTPDPTNNQGIDINTYQLGIDGYNILVHEQSEITFHFKSSTDVFWPSMLTFTTEVYSPSFCYDYAYSQNGVYITEDNNDTLRLPRITGFVTDGDDINVTVYIRNQEDSDVLAKNLTLDITDINTTQATYVRNTVYRLNPGEVVKEFVPDSNLSVADDYIKNITYADVAGKEHIYSYYTLNPNIPAALNNQIDIPLTGTFSYDLVLPLLTGGEITIPTTSTLGGTNLPLCSANNIGYITQANWSIFNVVDTSVYATGEKYNIPTQVARRPGDFSVVAYDPTIADNITPDINSTTLIGVDMIDAGAFHDIIATCSEATAGLSPILWMSFDGNSSVKNLTNEINDAINKVGDDRLNLASVNDYYPNAVKSAAWRISYVTLADGSGDLVRTEAVSGTDNVKLLNFTELVQDIGSCKQPVRKFADSDITTTNVPVACANAGNAGLSPFEVQRCLECLFGYNTKHICSRDNFSIRPESFNVKLNDTNQSNIVSLRLSDDRTGVIAPNLAQTALAAGYNYEFEINATSYTGNEATPGYTRYFNDENTSDFNISLNWTPSTYLFDPLGVPYCNDTNATALTLNMTNGKIVDFAKHQNVGEYTLNVIDKAWTSVDWDPEYMDHHDNAYFIGGKTGKDCKEDSSVVLLEGDPTVVVNPGTPLETLINMNGCNIDTNEHNSPRPAPDNLKYRDYNLSFHPYDFNLSAISFQKGNIVFPTNVTANNAFVYHNSLLNNTDDVNMSVRYTGIFRVVGADDVTLSNFVQGCYAQDVDLDVKTSDVNLTIGSPLYTYRLRENNVTGELIGDTIRGTNVGAKNLLGLITLPEGNFTKSYKGIAGIELNLNYNRTVNTAINPINVNYEDFNVSCTTPNDCASNANLVWGTPRGTKLVNQSIVHLYGREHIPRHRSETQAVTVPIYYEFYCDDDAASLPAPCTIANFNNVPTAGSSISPLGLLSPDAVRWYVQNLHDVTVDGNATAVRTRANLEANSFTPDTPNNIDINATATGIDFLYNGVAGFPYKVTMEVTTPDWLIYNRFDGGATVNTGGNVVNNFELEFTSRGIVGGIDNTSGTNVDANSSVNVNRRIQW